MAQELHTAQQCRPQSLANNEDNLQLAEEECQKISNVELDFDKEPRIPHLDRVLSLALDGKDIQITSRSFFPSRRCQNNNLLTLTSRGSFAEMKAFFSYKMRKPALRYLYLVVVNTITDRVVFVYGPCPAATS